MIAIPCLEFMGSDNCNINLICVSAIRILDGKKTNYDIFVCFYLVENQHTIIVWMWEKQHGQWTAIYYITNTEKISEIYNHEYINNNPKPFDLLQLFISRLKTVMLR